MRRQLIASLGLVVLLGIDGASAQAVEGFELATAADLLDVCVPVEGDPMAEIALGFCYGYIVGTTDLYVALVEAEAIDEWVCAIPTPGLTDVHSAFVDWAKANPGSLDGDPVDVFWRAMAATYPCP